MVTMMAAIRHKAPFLASQWLSTLSHPKYGHKKCSPYHHTRCTYEVQYCVECTV